MAERPLTPLLDALERCRIVSVKPQSNGAFCIREECDGNFYDEFTAEQLVELAGELLALAATAYVTEPQGE